MNQTFLFYRMNESWDTGDKLLINIAQAVCQCTNADRPVLVTADGPTCINVPEDTGKLSSNDKPLVNIAKVSQQTVAVVAVLRLSLSMTWHILTGLRTPI